MTKKYAHVFFKFSRATSGLKRTVSPIIGTLFILVKNPQAGCKQTPQDSIRPTPHPKRIEDIEALLKSAIVRQSQSALRDLVRSDRPLARKMPDGDIDVCASDVSK